MKAALSSLVLGLVFANVGCSTDSGTSTATGGSGGKSSVGSLSGGGNSSPASSGGGGSSSSSSSAQAGSSATGGKSSSPGGSSQGGSTGGGGAAGGAGKGGTSAGGVTTGGTNSRGGSGGGGGTTVTGGAVTGGSASGGITGSGGTTSASTSTIIGATPPMGWNSWNKFACGNDFNEKSIKEIADAFVSSGMKDAGYQYVNLDDCWMNGRDSATKKVKVDTGRFPAGLKALADYVHEKGLKFGLYSTPNDKTCSGLYGNCTGCVGSKGYETEDAQSYAEWGVDYLKYDKCGGDRSRFATMYNAIQATKRPIFISINPADQNDFCTAAKCNGMDVTKVSNMWRIEMDIGANWSSVIRLVDADKEQYAGAGPGHWNDPDMLEVGNYGLSEIEGRAHFSMWVIMAAPLLSGNDIRKMDATTKAILTNKEAIALNQDPLGEQGRVVATPGANLEVWSKKLSGTNARGVALFNRGTGNANFTVKWSDIGLPAGVASVRDIWAAKDVGPATDSYTATNVAGHSVVLLKIVSGS